jgi:amidase
MSELRGEVLAPLHGVPVTVKVNVDQAGRATTNGVVAFKDHRHRRQPGGGQPAPRRRRDDRAHQHAGVFGALVHRQRAARPHAQPLVEGPHARRVQRRRLVGGGRRHGRHRHGNDLAGSVRYPAYCTGVCGLRPSFGRVPAFLPSATRAAAVDGS